VKLEVTVSEGSTVFRWMYTFGGIDAPDKCVAIGYKDDFLKYFIDNWELYKIGSTSVNVSEEETIDIAMERARGFSWNMGYNEAVKISGFTVTNAMIWENVFCSNLFALMLTQSPSILTTSNSKASQLPAMVAKSP
jgi:hypothetical protein